MRCAPRNFRGKERRRLTTTITAIVTTAIALMQMENWNELNYLPLNLSDCVTDIDADISNEEKNCNPRDSTTAAIQRRTTEKRAHNAALN